MGPIREVVVEMRDPMRAAAVLSVALALTAAGAPTASARPPGTTARVSVSTDSAAGDNDSQLPAISADGRFVAFRSLASTLVPGDTNEVGDVFVHDRSTGVTERVSVDSRERQAVGADQGGVLDSNFGPPAISADGRFVAFASSATNLVKSDRNQVADIFVRDRAAGTTERVSIDRPQDRGQRRERSPGDQRRRPVRRVQLPRLQPRRRRRQLHLRRVPGGPAGRQPSSG